MGSRTKTGNGYSTTYHHPLSPTNKILVPVPSTVCSIGLEVLVLTEVGASAMRHNKHSIEVEVKTSPWPLGAHHALEATD